MWTTSLNGLDKDLHMLGRLNENISVKGVLC